MVSDAGATVNQIDGSVNNYLRDAFLQLAFDVPFCLFQILDCVCFQIGTPDVFHSVAEIEPHVLRNGDALDAARVTGVMLWMIYWVTHLDPRILQATS